MDDLIEIVPGARSGLLEYVVILIDISVIPKEKFKGHPALLALLETLQLASEGKLVANFDRITGYFTPIKNDPRTEGWLRSLARYAMSVGKIGTEIIAKAYSKVFNEKEAQEMVMTTAQELVLEGRAEEKVETSRKMVLTALRAKFNKVPKGIEKAVLAMSDPIALESLVAGVIHSKTLDEFATALK